MGAVLVQSSIKRLHLVESSSTKPLSSMNRTLIGIDHGFSFPLKEAGMETKTFNLVDASTMEDVLF